MLLRLKQGDDFRFLYRSKLGKYGRLVDCFHFFLFTHRFKNGACQGIVGADTHLAGDGANHCIIVARQNLDFNAMFMQLLDGAGCRLLGRIQKSQISNQYHIFLVLDTEIASLVQVAFVGYGNDTHALLVHLLNDVACLVFQFDGHGVHLSIKFSMRADVQHFLYGSFGNNLSFSLTVFYHYRHSSPGKIKRNFIYLCVIIFQVFQRQVFYVRQNGFVHQVL